MTSFSKAPRFSLSLLPAIAVLALPMVATAADPAVRMAQDAAQPSLESDIEQAIEGRKKRKPDPSGQPQVQPPPQPEAQPKTAAPAEPQVQPPPAEPAQPKTAAPVAPEVQPPPQPPAKAETAEPLDLEPQVQPPPAKPAVTVINPAKPVAPVEPAANIVVPDKPVTPPPPQAVAPAPVTPAASPATVAPAPNPAGPFDVRPAAPRRNPLEGTIGVEPVEPNTATPAAPPPVAPVAAPAVSPPKNLEDLKNARVRNVEAGGKRVVIREADNRVIVKQDNKVIIQSDENERLKRVAPTAAFQPIAGGGTKAIVERPGNVKIISETDQNGQIMRRYRQDGSGRETNIIDNRRRKKDRFGRNLAIGVGVGVGVVAGAAILNSIVNVPKPRVTIPREKYVVRYEFASEDDVYEALNAPPVDRGSGQYYTLDQVRATPRLRERMRRVDLDDINFAFGSWEVEPAEYRKLERVARAMMRVIGRNPNEVFLIEGYTDAVGSEVDNLTLSDRRAEAVAQVLTEQFRVPFENLTTQGYGENYLKIQTLAPERANRRSAVRRITPLLARGGEVDEPPPPPRRDDDGRRRYDDRRYDNGERRYDDRDRYDRNRDYDQRN